MVYNIGERLLLSGSALLIVMLFLLAFNWFQSKIEGEHYLFDDEDLFGEDSESEIDYRTRHK